MKTKNLKELRELRIVEKATKARIEQIMADAKAEAINLCPNGGEFTVEGVGTFILDKVPVFDLTNFRTYKDEIAKLWRACWKKREKNRIEASAQSKLMAGYLQSFIKSTDKEPETYDYTVKVKA